MICRRATFFLTVQMIDKSEQPRGNLPALEFRCDDEPHLKIERNPTGVVGLLQLVERFAQGLDPAEIVATQ